MVDTQVRIVNKYGENVAMNGKEIGEILVKGKGVAQEELNQKTSNGWVHTGDFGTMDENGRIDVVKSNEDIIANDCQISTFEIENILNQHPSIQEVSVLPQPDAKKGEIAHAFLVMDNPIEKHELRKYIQKKDASITAYIKFTFMDELPKTPSGKILKKQLEKL